MSASFRACLERRAAPRRAAQGPVKLHIESGPEPALTGELVDIAAGGFRARHRFPGLRPGETVLFERRAGSGRACVVWTRIAGEEVESGFRILRSDRQ